MKRISNAAIVALVVVLSGCSKNQPAEIVTVPEFGKMSYVPEPHSVMLKCELTSTAGVTSCGTYVILSAFDCSKWSGELVGNTICSEITDLYRNTSYQYCFFITNGEEEIVSEWQTFTTAYDGPVPKNDYVDEWGINHGKGDVLGELVWAPVNCGYHKDSCPYGKYYQWGRKHGVGGAGFDLQRAQQWAGNNGAEDPTTLYAAESGSTFPDDWIRNGDGGFWNAGTEDNPEKTNYDPCPSGWRVPTGKEIDNLNSHKRSHGHDGQDGCWFWSESEGVLLTPGGLYSGQGLTLSDCGKKSFYWSSKQCYSLYIDHTWTKTQNCKLYEALNVRCIEE